MVNAILQDMKKRLCLVVFLVRPRFFDFFNCNTDTCASDQYILNAS